MLLVPVYRQVQARYTPGVNALKPLGAGSLVILLCPECTMQYIYLAEAPLLFMRTDI